MFTYFSFFPKIMFYNKLYETNYFQLKLFKALTAALGQARGFPSQWKVINHQPAKTNFTSLSGETT